jgi:hypothetical protein
MQPVELRDIATDIADYIGLSVPERDGLVDALTYHDWTQYRQA